MHNTAELSKKIFECSQVKGGEVSPACAYSFVDVLRRVYAKAKLSALPTPAAEPKLRPGMADESGSLQLEMSGDARSGLYNTRFIIAAKLGYPAMECVVNLGYSPRVTRADGVYASNSEELDEPLAFQLTTGGLALIRNFVDEKRLRGAFTVAEPIYPFDSEFRLLAGIREEST